MLFHKFDINKDGAVSFKELREGLMSMNVHLADNEIHALFHRLDADRDGNITQEELYNAILTKEKYTKNPNILQSKVNTDHVLRLIRKGVEKYSSLKEYVDVLVSKFDVDGDGMISFDELAEGLKSIGVKISDKEKLALMRELDKDRDGGIAKHELYNALS
jgi:Ca2+-binding EF-hand superfamily protein